MDLFEITNGHLYPSIHALMIEPFMSMWENDTSDGKENCIRDFRFIELVCSPKKSNAYHGYSSDIRPAKVAKEVYGDENYRMTDQIMLGIMKYKEMLSHDSPTYDMYESSLRAKEKTVNYFNDFDYNERTPHGSMVVKPRDISNALKAMPDDMKAIETMRDKVQQELLDTAKTRNSRKTGRYET